MAKFQHKAPISLGAQLLRIKQQYSNIEDPFYKNNEMRVRMHIKPTEDSDTYTVDISYKLNRSPYVLLISPQLKTYKGAKPHHLYDDVNGYPRLCLYYKNEWTKKDYIADTIIPWISTWLFAYEYWLITGIWEYAEVRGKKVKD